MATITLNGVDYSVYADQAEVDAYLAADLARAAAWEALDVDTKARAIVSATRLLQRQAWRDGPPSFDTPPQAVKDATALLAADIADKPKLGDDGSTASNVKAVGAGSARVEFFSPVEGRALPAAAFALLRGLLGPRPEDLLGLDNTAYGSHNCQRSRFDPTDYTLYGGGHLDERLEP